MTDTKNTYSYDFSATKEIGCEGDHGVGLWQFVVANADGSNKVMTMHTICRFGANYTTPPACPWNACDPHDP